MAEPWCEILHIKPPRLESVVGHREANTFALLIVTLLERAAPMTLAEAAERMAQAGAVDRQTLLASLSRCRPARPPVYRDGRRYTLDPYDHAITPVGARRSAPGRNPTTPRPCSPRAGALLSPPAGASMRRLLPLLLIVSLAAPAADPALPSVDDPPDLEMGQTKDFAVVIGIPSCPFIAKPVAWATTTATGRSTRVRWG